MFEEILTSRTTRILAKSADAASLRHQVIANNIANVNTPGFKRSDVVFASELENAIRQLDQSPGAKPISGGSDPLAQVLPRVVQERNTSSRLDGNNVDIDVEMAELGRNTLWYNAVSQQITWQYRLLRTAINEGRG
jgi:flagellar basal-body rod protein FlgB